MLYRKVVEVESLKELVDTWGLDSLQPQIRCPEGVCRSRLPSPRTGLRLCVASALLRNTSYASEQYTMDEDA